MNTFYFIGVSIIFIMLFYFFRKKNNTKQEVIPPKIETKNKWLYPTDNFGKLEKGVVNDLGTGKKETLFHKIHSESNTE